MGRRALPLQMDMQRLDQISRAVQDAVQHFGRLDILVNNAGLAPENLAENVREQDFDRTLAVNRKGTFFASQAAGRVMIRQKSGRIINMSSQAGFAALPTESVYCMTKAAIAHLTKCLAVEWGKYNITVNAVAPTFIRTPGTEECLANPAFRADVIERIAALHRIGDPMDVTGAVIFLASSAASLITGETILIDADGPPASCPHRRSARFCVLPSKFERRHDDCREHRQDVPTEGFALRILFIGDIFGRPGRAIVKDRLPGIVRDRSIDLIIANGENAAAGFGI